MALDNVVRVAGVVVLYNPISDYINNVRSYVDQVDHLYVVDNTCDSDNSWMLAELLDGKCDYIPLMRNVGVAFAYNLACKRAIKDGCGYILIMDQDSSFENCDASVLIRSVINGVDANVGIMTACHPFEFNPLPTCNGELDEVLFTMGSGCVLSLKAFEDVGLFDENLFLDCVDQDYCVRLGLRGYKIFVNKKILLCHRLGNIEQKRILGMKIFVSNHPPFRRYYITRNRLYMIERYIALCPKFAGFCFLRLFREIIAILLLERQKFEKINAIIKGFLHYMIRSRGRLPNGH